MSDQQQQAPAPGTQEHDAAMAAKYDAAQSKPEEQSAPSRPEWLPEKFSSPADLAKAYAELEKKLGEPKADPKPAPQNPLNIPADEAAANAAVAKAGLDMSALSQEFVENGDLTPESYQKLATAGIPEDMVRSYIDGQKALAAKYETEVFTAAGGDEAYRNMIQWAAKGLSEGEKKAFNDAVDSRNPDQARFAVQALRAKYEAQFGVQGQTLNGAAARETPYESQAQVIADMRNPLYAKDPAFRAKVERKLAISDNLYTIQQR